jgi:hypothetical protein
MRIQFLWYPDCPSHPQARELLARTLRELDVESHVEEICVRDWDQAREHQFPGSPTIRINSVDIDEQGADAMGVALTCRTYARPGSGFGPLPTHEQLADAIRRAASL